MGDNDRRRGDQGHNHVPDHAGRRTGKIMAAQPIAAKIITRRDTNSYLRPIAHALVEALDLQPPTPSAPGYWTRKDGFASVSAGIIKHDLRHATDRVRALLTFDASGVQDLVDQRLLEFFPDPEQLDSKKRRDRWARAMIVAKQVRRERVQFILRELSASGVSMDADSVVVHRVSCTFFGILSLRDSQRLLRLAKRGYTGIKKMKIDDIASE